VAATLERVVLRQGLRSSVLEGHAEPSCAARSRARDYVRATLETRRRKEADRQRRRLADEGALAFSVATDPDAVERALDAFLELESAGWKGRGRNRPAAGTRRAAFMSEAARRMAGMAHQGRDPDPPTVERVAAGLIGIDGPRAYYIKTTYDEAFARFSRGLLLTLDLTRYLLDDPRDRGCGFHRRHGPPMIDRVWTERMTIASVILSTRPGGGALFRAAVAVEEIRERSAPQMAIRPRAPVERIRGSRSPPATDAANNG
jgi:hypothetical protein